MNRANPVTSRTSSLVLPACAAVLLVAAGCGPGVPVDGDADGGQVSALCRDTPRPAFHDVYQQAFMGCATSGCHADGAGGLRFTSPDEFLAATVRKPSSEKPGASRITPGIPDQSYLYEKLLETANPRMPPSGPALSPDALRAVAGWICSGASATGGSGDGGSFRNDDGGFSGDGGGPFRNDDGGFSGDGGGPFEADGGGPFERDGGFFGDGGGPTQTDGGGHFETDGGGQPFDPDGGQSSGGDGGLDPDPTINAFDPHRGFVGSRVNIHGAHFTTDVQQLFITFTGGAQAPVDSTTETEIQTLVPGGAKTGPITVTVRGRPAVSGDIFEVVEPNPAPRLTGLSPATATVGSGATTLTLTGTSFVASSEVRMDGNPLETTFVDATLLTALVPATALAKGGLHVVVVSNPTPGGGFSAVQSFIVASPLPVIATLSPARAVAGSAALTLRLDGTGFTSDTAVFANGGILVSTYVGPTHLDVTVGASLLAFAGSLAITAENPFPGGGVSDVVVLPVENAAPTATALVPATLEVSAASQLLAVTGSDFLTVSRIVIDGNTQPTTFKSASRLETTLDASLVGASGSHLVAVRTPAPGGGTSPALTLSVTNPVPTLASATPNKGVTGQSDLFLQLAGTNFTVDSVVRLAGAAVPMTSVLSAVSIVAQMPVVAVAGDYQLTVFNPGPGGGTSNGVTVHFDPGTAPVIASLSPPRPASTSGFQLTISGSGFACTVPGTAGAVVFNGTALTPATCSSTQITVDLPATAAGSYLVYVRNQTTNTPSAAVNLTVYDPRPVPSLSSLAPALVGAGSAAQALTLTGTNFASDATVTVGTTVLATSLPDTFHATVTVPAALLASAGDVAVTITNPGPGGGTSAAQQLHVVTPNPVPAISSVTPSRVDVGSTNVVLHVTGSGLLASTTATLDGNARPVALVDGTHVDVTLQDQDVAVVGSRALVLANVGPGGGSSNSFSVTVSPLNPQPGLSSLSTASARAGLASLALTVDGTGFVATSAVQFAGSARATGFTSATRLTTTLDSADLAVAGIYPITIFSPTPGGGTSNALSLTVTNPVASIDTLSPASVAAGGPAFTLVVSGSLFTVTSVVRVTGGAGAQGDRKPVFVSGSQLTVELTGADLATAANLSVTVFNPSPGGGPSNAVTLPVTNPTPTVSGMSPCGAVAGGAVDLLVAVTGSGYVQGMTATFNGAPVTVAVTSSSSATLTVPPPVYATAPASGLVQIVMTTPSPGASSPAVDFGLASRKVSFLTDVQPIFDGHCIGCHTGPGAPTGLVLSSDARAAIVGVTAGEVPSIKYIQACRPTRAASFLLDKVFSPPPASGASMPASASPLSSTENQTLVDWVAAGAQ